MVEAPFRGEPATCSDDLELLIERKGFLEETHFKVAYSPVPDETVQPTGIGGVLATVAETTEIVYGERQLRTLRELGASGGGCEDAGAGVREGGRDAGRQRRATSRSPSSTCWMRPERRRTWPASCGVAAGLRRRAGDDRARRAVEVAAWPRVAAQRRVELVADLRERVRGASVQAPGRIRRTRRSRCRWRRPISRAPTA